MQTVSWAGSTYDIPNQRGDTPWSGLSDFAIAVAAKGINTGGGNFTLLADLNFGATFGLVSTYFKSRSANIATAGALRLTNTDLIEWRNTALGGNLTLGINASDQLVFNSVVLSAASVAAGGANRLAYYTGTTAVGALTAITASRALVSDSNGLPVAATTTATEIGYVNGVTSAIQTQINTKAPSASPTFTGQSLFADGDLTNPGISFSGDTNTGLQRNSSDVMNLVTGGSGSFQVGADQYVLKGQLFVKSGTVGAPGLAFDTEADCGLYKVGTNNIGLATNGVRALEITSAQAVKIKGTATNDNATAGDVGEYVESVVTNTTYGGSSTVYYDMASISLTAGDWDVTGMFVVSANSATFTTVNHRAFIGTTSGNNTTGLVKGSNACWIDLSNQLIGYNDASFQLTVPSFRMSLGSTTTVYWKTFVSIFTSGTPAAAARISARRVR